MEFIDSLSDEEYSTIEWQANEFAGRLLVPRIILSEEIEKAVRIVHEHGLQRAIRDNPEQLLASIAVQIGRVFDVSEEVIQIRAEREGLWPPR
jgi:Zn-dependent peptidase ImmA (M78 family)